MVQNPPALYIDSYYLNFRNVPLYTVNGLKSESDNSSQATNSKDMLWNVRLLFIRIFWCQITVYHYTSVNIAKTRSFPGADIGSDHELVMMTFKLELKSNDRGRRLLEFASYNDLVVANTFARPPKTIHI